MKKVEKVEVKYIKLDTVVVIAIACLLIGFIGGNIQLGRNRGQHGNFKIPYGEWVPVKSMGQDLAKNLVPLPVRDPSLVLFQLLGFLIDSGKELSAQVDVLSGESPGTHVPAQSTLALIEQGLKVYAAIMKRLYRAFRDKDASKFSTTSRFSICLASFLLIASTYFSYLFCNSIGG